MAIHFLFTGFLFALSIGENAADMSCHLEKVDGKPNKFAFHLWGKHIVRDCPVGKEFDAEKCRCDTKKPEKLEANEIVNGDQVHISEVPWIVVLGRACPTTYGQLSYNMIIWHCTGALIMPRWVLSAKHCQDDVYKYCTPTANSYETRKPTMYVEAGVSQYGVNEGEKVKVQAFYNHDVHTRMDIVLILLERAMPITHNIKTIPVMHPRSTFWKQRCIIAGFGFQWKEKDTRTGNMDGDQNTYLYKAQTTLLPPGRRCRQGWWDDVPGEEWYICTRDTIGLANTCSTLDRRRPATTFISKLTKDTGLEVAMWTGRNNLRFSIPPELGRTTYHKQGDSGGPLVCRDKRGVNRVVAVLSIGHMECNPGEASLYVYVKHFYKRMAAVIKQVEGRG